jgi:hypothetical protein
MKMDTKNVLRKAGYLGLSASFALALQSCSEVAGCNDSSAQNYLVDSDGTIDCIYPEANDNVVISSNITSNTTWTADKVYVLGGRISVESGAILTIEPGTVIKGEAGTGANATALLIARGAMLKAEGTAALPIIFTSIADEITPEDIVTGNYGSPNLQPTDNGYWGGVIVLGNAPVSASNDAGDVNEVQIEGVPTSDQNGLYGGSDEADNSGSLSYISIRHGGANIGSGNEINGLTLGGVGTGTSISNIEVVGNQDDGVEWFGGTVACTNFLTWNVGDDGLDTDQAWSGSLENFITITAAGHAFELDGPEGSLEGSQTFTNGAIIASSSDVASQDLINTDGNSMVTIENILFTEIQYGQIIDSKGQGAGVLFKNVLLDLPSDTLSVEDFTLDGDMIPGVLAGNTSPVDVSAFSWTWAHERGVISGL